MIYGEARLMRAMAAFSVLLISMLLASKTAAQYMYLDTNGDGTPTVADGLSGTKPTFIDVWVVTDANRDGSKPAAATNSAVPLSIFSYEFILRASGGSVEWVGYKNELPGMDFALGDMQSENEFYTGYAGSQPLAPGKYKLGTLQVRILSGNPTLAFASLSAKWLGLQTSFGSMNPGKEGANTLLFTEAADNVKSGSAFGDWSDADGLGAGSIQLANMAPAATFGVAVSPNPLNPDAVLTVSTTGSGFLRVRLFDVTGRFVRTLVDKGYVPAGGYKIQLSADRTRMASGVYFYSVDASEGHLQGRLVVLK